MKKIITFALLLIAFSSKAQTSPADSFLSFTVSLTDANAYASVIADPALLRAISKKFGSATDTATTRIVRLTQRDFLRLAEITNTINGPIWAARTQRMRNKLPQILSGRPWLAERILALQADFINDDNAAQARGAAILKRNRDYDTEN